jgi:hypothetical protein
MTDIGKLQGWVALAGEEHESRKPEFLIADKRKMNELKNIHNGGGRRLGVRDKKIGQ